MCEINKIPPTRQIFFIRRANRGGENQALTNEDANEGARLVEAQYL